MQANTLDKVFQKLKHLVNENYIEPHKISVVPKKMEVFELELMLLEYTQYL